jgi:glucose-1-phosphate adenylyltransferase
MVTSGIRNVGVLLPENKARSILDHLRSGKDWDLARHHKGLFYLPPVRPENGEKASDLRNIYYNLNFVENSNEEYVLLARATSVYNIDFNKVLKFHIDRGADVTVVTNKAWHSDPCSGLILEPGEDGRVRDAVIRPDLKEGDYRSLGIFLMSKELFCNVIRYAFEHGGTDFRRDAILKQATGLKFYAYIHEGFAARICSTPAFYLSNLKMLEQPIWEELFMKEDAPIITRVKDMSPTEYKEGANVKNSLIANGCEIHGTVENSVIFRNVKVAPGAVIRNSVVMEDCVLEEKAELEQVITDKEVTITQGKRLRGAVNFPVMIGKHITI